MRWKSRGTVGDDKGETAADSSRVQLRNDSQVFACEHRFAGRKQCLPVADDVKSQRRALCAYCTGLSEDCE